MIFSLSPSIAARDSLLARLGLAMGTIVLLSFISMVLSTLIADNSLGKANAINLAGSLRMMSYRLLSHAESAAPVAQIDQAMSEFRTRLDTLDHFVISRSADYSELPQRFRQVHKLWIDDIAPTLNDLNKVSDKAVLHHLESEIPDFVARIDGIVFLLEQDLEHKIALLRSLQIALLLMTVAVCFITMWMMKNQVVKPLKDLLHAASKVRDKDFSAKAQHTDQDELGQLGMAFNVMVSEIAATYDNQKRLIDERTQDLTDSNRSLELMYQLALQLSDSNLNGTRLKQLLDSIEGELELGAGTICIREHEVLPAHRLASNLDPSAIAQLCGERDCADCFGKSQSPTSTMLADSVQASPLNAEAKTKASTASSPSSMLFVPIKSMGSITGVMPFRIHGTDPIPAWKVRVLEAIGSNLSMALTKMQHQEELHRIAVLEERSIIARELHDSIAQSLSYLRIQVARLEKQQRAPNRHEIVAELKIGMASAYKELRELISAFRLKIDERGFQTALTETCEEFSRRCQLPIDYHNDLPPTLLSANEEIHVLRIIREALANIEKHAQAHRVSVDAWRTEQQEVTIRILDDGVGIGQAKSPKNHYGLIIMEDRAQSLNGTIRIMNHPAGGTEVLLRFTPGKSTL